MKVVLTVPHAKESSNLKQDEKYHLHDKKAKIFAEFLYKNFKNYTECFLLVGYVNRSQCDLNRITCYSTFRNQLNTILTTNNLKKNILLDIHSFPSKENQDYEIYFIITKYDFKSIYFANKLLANLNNKNIKTGILEGKNSVNYIIHKGYEYNYISILIEIRENLSRERIKYISEIIFYFIYKMST